MENSAKLRDATENSGKLRDAIENAGKLRDAIENSAKLRDAIENSGTSWKSLIRGNSKFSNEIFGRVGKLWKDLAAL